MLWVGIQSVTPKLTGALEHHVEEVVIRKKADCCRWLIFFCGLWNNRRLFLTQVYHDNFDIYSVEKLFEVQLLV